MTGPLASDYRSCVLEVLEEHRDHGMGMSSLVAEVVGSEAGWKQRHEVEGVILDLKATGRVRVNGRGRYVLTAPRCDVKDMGGGAIAPVESSPAGPDVTVTSVDSSTLAGGFSGSAPVHLSPDAASELFGISPDPAEPENAAPVDPAAPCVGCEHLADYDGKAECDAPASVPCPRGPNTNAALLPAEPENSAPRDPAPPSEHVWGVDRSRREPITPASSPAKEAKVPRIQEPLSLVEEAQAMRERVQRRIREIETEIDTLENERDMLEGALDGPVPEAIRPETAATPTVAAPPRRAPATRSARPVSKHNPQNRNGELVELIRTRGPISKAALAELTGRTVPAINTAVHKLIKRGIVKRTSPGVFEV